MRLWLRTASSAVLATLCAGGSALAQDNNTLDQVIVTATKSTATLQEVPLSITAVKGETLQAQGVTRFQDLTGTIPNFTVSQSPISDVISMRGINSDLQAAGEQAVATFVDGVYRGRGVQSRFAFLDMGSLEVVRGPQGTLFGKNTVGGALNINSARPSAVFDGSISAGYEFEQGETEVLGFITGPVSDRVRVRAGFQYNQMKDGWVDNSYYDEAQPRYTNWAGRLSAEADLSEDAKLFVRYDHSDFDTKGNPIEIIHLGGALAPLLSSLDVDGNIDGKARQGNSSAFLDLGSAFVMDGGTDELMARLDWRTPIGDWTTIAAYSGYDFLRAFDADLGPLDVLQVKQDEKYEQYSLESRISFAAIGKVRPLAGVYLQQSQLDNDGWTYANTAPLGVPFPPLNRFGRFNQESKLWAVFGQATIELTNKLEATGGLRYASEKKDALQEITLTNAVTGGALPAPVLAVLANAVLEATPHVLRPSSKENDTSWSANLRWKPTDEASFYVSAAHSTLGGGFNAAYFGTGGARPGETADQYQQRMLREIAYRPEKATSYEVGAKLRFGGRAELNAAVFHVNYDDIQTSQFTGGTSYVVGNAAAARARGMELDGRWRPVDELTLTAAIGYIDFEYTDYKNAGCTVAQIAAGGYANGALCSAAGVNDLTGRTNQITPEWTASFGVRWVKPIGDYELTVDGQANYVDQFYGAQDLDPQTLQKAVTKVNLLVGVGPSDRGWSLDLVTRNLTNERTFQTANDVPLATGSYFATIERPRSVALRLRVNF